MSSDPARCTLDTSLPGATPMMAEHDCNCIPVLEDQNSRKSVRMITDRGIALRGVGSGQEARVMKAGDCSPPPVVTVGPENGVDNYCRVLEDLLVRRVVVVDQANGTRQLEARAADIIREVSQPCDAPNSVSGQ